MSELLKVGSLWRGQDKNGNEMLSGQVSTPVDVVLNSETRLLILTNDRKEAENHPDFNVFLSKNEPK